MHAHPSSPSLALVSPITRRPSAHAVRLAILGSIVGTIFALAGWSPRRTHAVEPPQPVVRITLRAEATVEPGGILVEDVATLLSADIGLRRRIARLDLDDSPVAGRPLAVSRQQLEFRLQAAGISRDLFVVQGATCQVRLADGRSPAMVVPASATTTARIPATSATPSAVASSASPAVAAPAGDGTKSSELDGDEPRLIGHEELVAAAEQFLTNRVPWPAEQIKIRIGQAIKVSAQAPSGAKSVRLEPRLRSAWPPIGRVQVGVELYVDGRRHAEVPLFFEVVRTQTVVAATRRVERGETLTAEMVQLEPRESREPHEFLTSVEPLIGRKTKRPLAPHQAMTEADVALDGATGGGGEIVVRRREMVTLSTRIGQLQVSTQGEAQQDGRVGEAIRVRNADSSTVVVGKVMQRGLVEVTSPVVP